jgi:imidazolonepropionase-like amidohydrolase
VRYGLSSGEALRALTSGAAKLMKLDSRVGLIAPGRDADLVILSGEPFEPTTRVRSVIVGGRVAFDASGSEPW